MNILKNGVKYILIIFIGVNCLIMLPQLIILGIMIPPIYFIGNKISYKNKNSKAFGISKKNTISPKIGNNILSSVLSKDNDNYFKEELSKLVVDMEPNTDYSLTGSAKFKRMFYKAYRLGYVSNFSIEEVNNKFSVNNFVNNMIIGSNSPLKSQVNYNISFQRSDLIDDFNNIHTNLTTLNTPTQILKEEPSPIKVTTPISSNNNITSLKEQLEKRKAILEKLLKEKQDSKKTDDTSKNSTSRSKSLRNSSFPNTYNDAA